MKKLIFKTVLPLLAVVLLAVALATSCEKDKNENALTVSGVSFTACHGEGDKSYENPDSVAVTISDKTVYVTHYNLDVNCGWQDIDVQCRLSNDSVYVREYEITPVQANCSCETNNSFQINGLSGGRTYTLVIEFCYPSPIYKTVML
jgi:hypothetical protein